MSRPVASGELLSGSEHADRASPPSETDEQLVGRLLREEDDRERGKPNSELFLIYLLLCCRFFFRGVSLPLGL